MFIVASLTVELLSADGSGAFVGADVDDFFDFAAGADHYVARAAGAGPAALLALRFGDGLAGDKFDVFIQTQVVIDRLVYADAVVQVSGVDGVNRHHAEYQ